MAGLPAAMQAKKVQLEAVHLEPIAVVPAKRPVPVVVNTDHKEPEKKPDAVVTTIDESQFVVSDEPAGDEKPTEVTEVKPVVQVDKPVDGEEGTEGNWKWMYKSLEGNHKLIVEENRVMRDKLVELETKLNMLVDKPAVVTTKVDATNELTTEELEEFAGALPVLNKLLAKQQRQIEESVVKPLQLKVTELEKSTTAVADKAAASDEGSFVQQVKMQVKNFDDILKSPQWQDFTKKPISSYTDETIGQALWNAHKKRDLKKVTSIFEDFTKQNTSGAADAYRGLPVSKANGALPSDSSKKTMLKWSKREEASVKFRKRQIGLVEYEAIKKLYQEAEAEGRIDFTK